mmetsp:Transcript_6225/g.25907  ORF Transcript_6225/g.25907 Transcript_6225/m.25907 type:complete len:212 (+) Transcript_6225:1169-1804(+)
MRPSGPGTRLRGRGRPHRRPWLRGLAAWPQSAWREAHPPARSPAAEAPSPRPGTHANEPFPFPWDRREAGRWPPPRCPRRHPARGATRRDALALPPGERALRRPGPPAPTARGEPRRRDPWWSPATLPPGLGLRFRRCPPLVLRPGHGRLGHSPAAPRSCLRFRGGVGQAQPPQTATAGRALGRPRERLRRPHRGPLRPAARRRRESACAS